MFLTGAKYSKIKYNSVLISRELYYLFAVKSIIKLFINLFSFIVAISTCDKEKSKIFISFHKVITNIVGALNFHMEIKCIIYVP